MCAARSSTAQKLPKAPRSEQKVGEQTTGASRRGAGSGSDDARRVPRDTRPGRHLAPTVAVGRYSKPCSASSWWPSWPRMKPWLSPASTPVGADLQQPLADGRAASVRRDDHPVLRRSRPSPAQWSSSSTWC